MRAAAMMRSFGWLAGPRMCSADGLLPFRFWEALVALALAAATRTVRAPSAAVSWSRSAVLEAKGLPDAVAGLALAICHCASYVKSWSSAGAATRSFVRTYDQTCR